MRLALLLKGQMPLTKELPCSWYDTPNIHFCTIRDFVNPVEAGGVSAAAVTSPPAPPRESTRS